MEYTIVSALMAAIAGWFSYRTHRDKYLLDAEKLILRERLDRAEKHIRRLYRRWKRCIARLMTREKKS